jgi:hypothetical protein
LEVYKRFFANNKIAFGSPKKELSFEWKDEQHRAYEDLKEKTFVYPCVEISKFHKIV